MRGAMAEMLQAIQSEHGSKPRNCLLLGYFSYLIDDENHARIFALT
jgi:hypothetical protein